MTHASDKISVLIVEDEMMVAMHLAMMVRNLGHEVIGIAVDSKNAVLLAEKKPDLALVDCNLRDGHTGPQVARHIADKAESHVVFITADPQRVMEPANDHPAILGVAPKPVNDNDVAELLGFAHAIRRSMASAKPPAILRSLRR